MSELPTNPAPDHADSAPRAAALAHLQPFGDDIHASWRDQSASVELHEDALHTLRALRSLDDEGRLTLLSAPRAGHGKTHLISRAAENLKEDMIVIGLPWQTVDSISWEASGRGVLLDLASTSQQPTALQRYCGGILATLLRRLIQTGRIPSADPAQALRVLAQDPMDLFNENGPAKVIGEWFRKHFDQLRRPLAEISSLDELDLVEDWLQIMFDYLEHPSAATLAVMESRMSGHGASQLPRFLRLGHIWKPIVLVADHMDALYRDPESGMNVARMALALTSLPGVRVVLSMNEDLWETTFGRQLPSALEDRLNARSVSLHGLNAEEARAMVSLRLGEAGVTEKDESSFIKFLDLDHFFLGRPAGTVAARHLLRYAAQKWRTWLLTEDEPEVRINRSEGTSTPELADAPLPLLQEVEPENDEKLQHLAAQLAEDSRGREIDIAHHPLPNSDPPPPKPVPLPSNDSELEGAESFLLDNDPPAPPAYRPAPEQPRGSLSSTLSGQSEHLLQILAKLKPGAASEPASPAIATSPVGPPPLPPSSSVAASQSLTPPEPPTPPTQPSVYPAPGDTPPPQTAESLYQRFLLYRQQAATSSLAQRLSLPAITELIKLAGRRFPLVTYDEVSVHELAGRSLHRWMLQGQELLFGLDEFKNVPYWKTVVSFVVGRVAEQSAAKEQTGDPPPVLKLIAFKDDHDAADLAALVQQGIIPPALRTHLDLVHLDSRSLASIHAMHRLVREAETGALQTDPTLLLGIMARELDFFWKRLTRPPQ